MNRLTALTLACLVLGVGGCWMDGPTGMVKQPDGTMKYEPSKDTVTPTLKVVETVGSGTPVGWVATGLLALLNIYQGIREKGKTKALAVTVEGVESFANTDAGKVVGDQLKAWLEVRHTAAGVTKIVQPIVDKYGHEVV